MEKRTLGASELKVERLGMGCWQYGGGTYWGAQSQKDVEEVVHQALELGINYFDTAEVYNDGASERSLGEALKGRRSQAIIGSKVNSAHTRAHVLKEHCEASLKRLQTDYIDLYMLHWPMNPLSVKHYTDDPEMISHPPDLQEVFGSLQELQHEGKIRYIGISNHGIEQMKQVQATGVPVVANELAYNLFSRAIEEEIVPYCAQHQIGIIGYIPLMQGLLSGKYTSLDEMKPLHTRTRHFHHNRGEGTRHGEEGAEAEMTAALQELRSLAGELGVTVLTLALSWTVSNPHIATMIVGSRTKEQLVMNYRAASYQLTSDVIRRLNEITQPVLAKLGSNPDYYENRYNSRVY